MTVADDFGAMFDNTPADDGKQPDPAPSVAVEPPKPAEPTPAPLKAETPPAPKAEAPKGDPVFVQLSAVLDEREKRQKAEARLAELEAKQQQPEAPSFQTAEEWRDYVQSQAAEAVWNAKAGWSEHAARTQHGKDVVDKALEWAYNRGTEEKSRLNFSPFALEQMRQQHPVDWVVRQYKQNQTLAEYGDDEATQKAYIERRARELGLIPAAADPAAPAVPAAQPQPTLPQKVVPSRSLASAPSAGGIATPVMKSDADTFKEAFL